MLSLNAYNYWGFILSMFPIMITIQDDIFEIAHKLAKDCEFTEQCHLESAMNKSYDKIKLLLN